MVASRSNEGKKEEGEEPPIAAASGSAPKRQARRVPSADRAALADASAKDAQNSKNKRRRKPDPGDEARLLSQPAVMQDGSGTKKRKLQNKRREPHGEAPTEKKGHHGLEEEENGADFVEGDVNSGREEVRRKAESDLLRAAKDPDAPNAAAAAAAAAAHWSSGRRWVVLLSYCPLLLLRRRSSSKKEKNQQQTSCLFTAEEHSGLLESFTPPGVAAEGNSISTRGSGKKSLNPVMPVVRRVQAHLTAVSSTASATQKDACNEVTPTALSREGPVGARVRECVAAEAAKVAAAAADPNWVATACMRPDVVHQCLLSFLDSPIMKLMRLQHQQSVQQQPLELLLHTLDGKLLRISSEFRVPRTFKVFKKVMEMALSSPTGRLEAKAEEAQHSQQVQQQQHQQPLIEVLQPPFWKHFPEGSWSVHPKP